MLSLINTIHTYDNYVMQLFGYVRKSKTVFVGPFYYQKEISTGKLRMLKIVKTVAVSKLLRMLDDCDANRLLNKVKWIKYCNNELNWNEQCENKCECNQNMSTEYSYNTQSIERKQISPTTTTIKTERFS